jgi:hypothetical protein
MRLRAAALILALAATLTYGQTPASEAKPQEALQAEVIHVTTLTGDSFDRLVRMLGVFNVRIQADSQLRTIVVYAPKDVVAQIKRVVAELDTPGSDAAIGRNIEMTMTLLQCSTKQGTGAKLPGDIEPVAKQLRAATQYKDIRIWDVIPLRLQEGKDTTEDMQLPTGTARQAILDIRLTPEAATRKSNTWSVRFRRLNISLKIPVQAENGSFSWQDVGLNTSGDFLEGQKTVLGKVSGLDNDSAIFFVISLKVLE